MKEGFWKMAAAALLTLFCFSTIWADGPPPKTDHLLSKGTTLFKNTCAPCHGIQGDGQGPMAKVLNPPPWDFTRPFQEWEESVGDPRKIFEIIKNGIPNTAMTGFKMPEEDIWALVYKVMEFSRKNGA
jgi:high-affinity iron transporter